MTTRLSNHAKDQSLTQLLDLLNNVCRFVDLPVKDRTKMLALWNNRFPADLTKSISILGTYDMGLGQGATDHMRWATVIKGKVITSRIDVQDLTPLDMAKRAEGEMQFALSLATKAGKCINRGVAIDMPNNFNARIERECPMALEVTPEYMAECLGTNEADAMIEWMQTCATMFGELKSAAKVLTDIFHMAKTAGQIKRMVPDLMQYLPEKNRVAFEEQKRSSTVPFEWAPYDKTKIGDMLLQVSKGHLLSHMGKSGNDSTVGNLQYQTWAVPCEWSVPVP